MPRPHRTQMRVELGIRAASLDATESMLTFTVTASGHSGEVRAMHFHEASAGTIGPVLLDVTS